MRMFKPVFSFCIASLGFTSLLSQTVTPEQQSRALEMLHQTIDQAEGWPGSQASSKTGLTTDQISRARAITHENTYVRPMGQTRTIVVSPSGESRVRVVAPSGEPRVRLVSAAEVRL